MDFAFFAIAFNIKKMCAKSLKNGIKLEFAISAIKNDTNQVTYKGYRKDYTEHQIKFAAWKGRMEKQRDIAIIKEGASFWHTLFSLSEE